MSSSPVDIQDEQQLIAAASPFEEWYLALQERFPRVHTVPSHETIPLVTGQLNADLPIHRWYNLKESFSAKLPLWLCDWMREHYQHAPRILLDAFIGGGTTGVSLTPLGVEVSGVEYNPFIRFVSATKAAVPLSTPSEFEHAMITCLEKGKKVRKTPLIPALSTLHDEKYCDEQDIRKVLRIADCINHLDVHPSCSAMLQLGIAAAIDSIFHLRKDGRALRYEVQTSIKPVYETLRSHWKILLQDLQAYHGQHPSASTKPLFAVYEGSAINLQALHERTGESVSLANEHFDTIMYSPPYLNNFDYSEIYKLELWLLRFIESYEVWKTLRLGTIRSHYSISFPQTQYLANDSRTGAIAARIRSLGQSSCIPDEERNRVKLTIEGYFDDMYLALCEQWRVLKPGGILTYVVANSRHYYLPVATDVILAEIACCLGFEPLDLVVLRKRNGRTRQKLFLRESAVFLRKPFHLEDGTNTS